MLKRIWRKGNIPTSLLGMQTDIVFTENSMEIPLKTRNKSTLDILIYISK